MRPPIGANGGPAHPAWLTLRNLRERFANHARILHNWYGPAGAIAVNTADANSKRFIVFPSMCAVAQLRRKPDHTGLCFALSYVKGVIRRDGRIADVAEAPQSDGELRADGG